MSALRLGVIGYGRRIHRLVHGPFREVDPDLRLMGVVDPDDVDARAHIGAVTGAFAAVRQVGQTAAASHG